MRIIVMGCGRVGSQIARLMSDEGHEVMVIEQDPAAIARLGPFFQGAVIRGLGFDRQVLIDAGIEQADAFVAASQSDNANIIAARIARNIFHVPRVVARLYDPLRAEIYRRLGLLTISTTTWGAERIRELVTVAELDPVFSFGSGEVSLVALEIPAHLIGRMVRDLTVVGESYVVSITREGEAFLPVIGTEFRQGDMVHVAVMANAMNRFKTLLGLGEEG